MNQPCVTTYWKINTAVTENFQRGMETRHPEDPVTNGAGVALSMYVKLPTGSLNLFDFLSGSASRTFLGPNQTPVLIREFLFEVKAVGV